MRQPVEFSVIEELLWERLERDYLPLACWLDGMTDEELAHAYGFSRRTANRFRNKLLKIFSKEEDSVLSALQRLRTPKFSTLQVIR